MSGSGSASTAAQFGKYRLLSRLAVGGMAEIYLAVAPGIGGFEKRLALKMIHPQYSQDDLFIRMLINEAKLCVELNHPNIVQVFDLGRTKQVYFIAMEYVEGCDTFHLLKTLAEQGKRLEQSTAAFVAHEVAMGLEYAHTKTDDSGAPLGIIHRDISPQNVLLSINGEVKLVDFGIAKARLRIAETQAGVVKGKHYYMSPEQAAGEELDPRTDVFSLGIVLWEMLAGRMCYLEDNHLVLMDRVLRADVPPIARIRPDVHPHLAAIAMTAVRRNRDDRYQTAGELAAELSEYLFETADFNRTVLANAISEVLALRPLAEEETARDRSARDISREDLSESGITSDSLLFKLPLADDDWGDDETTSSVTDERLTPQEGREEFDDATVVDPAAVAKALAELRAQQEEIIGVSGGEEEGPAAPGEPVPGARATVPLEAPLAPGGPTIPLVAPKPLQPPPRLGIPAPIPTPVRAAGPPSPARTARPGVPAEDEHPTIVDEGLALEFAQPATAPPAAEGTDSDSGAPTSQYRGRGWATDSAVTVERKGSDRQRTSSPVPGAGALPHTPEARGSGPVGVAPAPVAPGSGASPMASAPAPASAAAEPYPAGAVDSGPIAPPREGGSAIKTVLAAMLVAIAVAGAIVGGFYLMQYVQKTRRASTAALGSVKVTSEPKHARVLLDGVDVDVLTPTVINRIAAGKSHELEVRLEYHLVWKKKFSVASGEQGDFHAELEPITGTIKVTTVPREAEVFYEGESRGNAPVTIKSVPIGSPARLEARLEGRKSGTIVVETKDWGEDPGDEPELPVEIKLRRSSP